MPTKTYPTEKNMRNPNWNSQKTQIETVRKYIQPKVHRKIF